MYYASKKQFRVNSAGRDVSHEAGAVLGLVNALPMSLVLWLLIVASVKIWL